MSIHSASCLCSPYSFPKYFCFCSIRRLYPLTYFQDVCKNVPGYCGISCCFEINYVVISFCFSGFCCFLCFSTFITKGKPSLFNSYFWSSNSFSLVLSFFHRPTIHLFNRDPLLISWHYSIFFFSRMVFSTFTSIPSCTFHLVHSQNCFYQIPALCDVYDFYIYISTFLYLHLLTIPGLNHSYLGYFHLSPTSLFLSIIHVLFFQSLSWSTFFPFSPTLSWVLNDTSRRQFRCPFIKFNCL